MAGSNALKDEGYDDEIIALLHQVGQRLLTGERDRKELRRAMDDLAEKADQGERAYLTVQDRLSKAESAFEKTRQNIEQAQAEQEERLQRADAAASRLEEVLAQQVKITRRIEKVAQERAQMIRKLERIEEAVIETHDAVNARTLSLLSAQAPGKAALPQALAADEEQDNDPAEERPWWRRHGPVRAAIVIAMTLAGVAGGFAVNRMDIRLSPSGGSAVAPDLPETASSALDSAVPPSFSDLAAYAPEQAENAADPAFSQAIDEALGAGQEQDTPQGGETADEAPPASYEEDNAVAQNQSPAEPAPAPEAQAPARDPLDMSDEELLASLNNDPDVLAARLNEITTGTGRTPAQGAKEALPTPAPARKPEKASFTPPQKKAPAVISSADFLKTQRAALTLPLSQRIAPDTSLPPPIREVEKKAFEGVPEAQHDLAAIYTAGHGNVKIDYARAAAWFREAALNGVANARYNLGVLYHQGLGVTQDINTAVGWYRAAAEMGHPEALYNLGIASIEGVGTAYDPDKAASYFEQAAKKGIMEAAYNLGLIYENGLTGESRPNDALSWYKRAADLGSPEAKVAMDQLARTLGLQPAEVERMYGAQGDDDGAAKAPPPPAAPAKSAARTAPPPPPGRASSSDERYDYIEAQPLDPLPVPASSSAIETAPRAAAPAAAEPAGEDPATIAQIQEQLIRLGLYPGPADGVNDGLTADAIRSYQADNRLTADGRATRALLVHMMTSGAEYGSRAE